MQNILMNKKKGNIIVAALLIGVACGSALYFGGSVIGGKESLKPQDNLSIETTPATLLPSTLPSPTISTIPLTAATPSPVNRVVAKTKSKPTRETTTLVMVPTNSNSVFLNLVNSARRSNGLSDVKYNGTLNQAAKNKCQDMQNQNYFSHTNPQGKNDFSFVKDLGYNFQAIGSNISKGLTSEQSVFDGWMNSPDHKENILKSWGKEIGYANFGGYACMFIAKLW